MTSKLGEYLDNVIYPRLDRAIVFHSLNPVRKGEIINADCPKCGKRGKAWIKQSGHSLVCWSCDYSVRILAYVAGEGSPRGKEFLDALNKLADMAGVPSPEQALPSSTFKAIRAEAAKATAYERILEVCKSALDSPWEAEAAREYLERRKFNIADHPLGWLENSESFREECGDDLLLDCGFAKKDDKTGRIYFTWRNRIIGPFFDRHGRIIGFWGRSLDDQKNPPKYRWTAGASVATSGAYGLADARLDYLILVEGVLDVFKARQHGIFNLAAFGGTSAQNRWDGLSKWHVGKAVLLFDNDEPGHKATLAAIESAFKLAKGLTLYAVPPSVMGECKDPDEYMDKWGGEALRLLVEKHAIPAAIYYAKAVFDGSKRQRNT